MRKYEQTHSWINFTLDLRRLNPRLWMVLGEVQSKCEHIAGVPLRRETADVLYRLYLAKGVLGTTAIEGNTLSEEEVLNRIQGKLKLPPSKEYLGQEIDNIVEVCNQITERVLKDRAVTLTVEDIKNFNRTVLKNLSLDEGVVPGEIRMHSVGVARYRAVPAEDCEFLLEKLCAWLNDFPIPEHYAHYPIAFGLIKAILAHIYLAWIHPFGDGNGRTARLIEFTLLLGVGVPSAAAHLLSNHYNQTRQEYYRQLDQASRSGGDLLPFMEYAVQGFVDGLKEQLKHIRDQQWDVTWKNYVHEQFKDKNSAADVRRRHLVLDLSRTKDPVPLPKIRQISPRIAESYANKTAKTITRDINILTSMGLVKWTLEGLRAKREIVLAFLPGRVE